MLSVRIAAAIIVLIGICTYMNSLGGSFIWDDQTAILTNQSIRQLGTEALFPPPETPMAGRPVANLTLAVNYAIGGFAGAGYHVVNIGIHIVCALLLFGIVRRTLAGDAGRSNRPSRPGPASEWTALVVALVWMVHPLHTEVVDYITQRTESTMALLLFLTLYAAIRGWTGLSIAACALGMATKESMVVAPIVVLLYDRAFLFPTFRDAVRRRPTLYTGLAATWVVLAIVIATAGRSTVGATTTVSAWTYLLNQSRMIVRYLALTVWPRALALDYGLPRPLAFVDVAAPMLLLAGLVAATVVAFVRWPRFGFLPAVFFLTLAPTSSLVPIVSEVGAERRMYVPLAALITLVVVLIARGLERRPARRIAPIWLGVAAMVVLALAIRTIARNQLFAEPLALWRSSVGAWPQGRAQMSYAIELVNAGRHDEAMTELREAIRDYPDARFVYATELAGEGSLDAAATEVREFIRPHPDRVDRLPGRLLLGRILSTQGKLAEAETEFRLVLQQDPANALALQSLAELADAHNQAGVGFATRGDIGKAIPEFQAAVRLNPSNQQARNNLARALQLSQPSLR